MASDGNSDTYVAKIRAAVKDIEATLAKTSGETGSGEPSAPSKERKEELKDDIRRVLQTSIVLRQLHRNLNPRNGEVNEEAVQRSLYQLVQTMDSKHPFLRAPSTVVDENAKSPSSPRGDADTDESMPPLSPDLDGTDDSMPPLSPDLGGSDDSSPPPSPELDVPSDDTRSDI